MPIKIPDSLPARATLEGENIFVMTEYRAIHQDMRPLNLLILNLMPTKIVTETQLLRKLSNTPLQIQVELLQMASHVSQNTDASHLASFYTTFDQIKDKRYDGMIITGAPVENLDFADVDYWPELCDIMEWTKTHVHSTPPCMLGGSSRPLLPLRHSQILSAQKTVRCLPTYYYKKTIPPVPGI